jgi:ubiquinone/menaquinone biosynthesis C-methylase UbiE
MDGGGPIKLQLRRLLRRPDHFSLLAPYYDRVFSSLGHDRLRELLDLPAEGRLLDAGGGTGRVSEAFARLVDEIVVTDLSSDMLRQTHAKDGLRPIRAQAEHLPFPDGCFARMLVVDAFHHFQVQEEAARELVRVLAPGGRLVIEEPNVKRWSVKLLALAERLMLMHSRFHAPQAMQRIFERHGAWVTVHAEDTANAWLVVEKDG